MIKLVQDKYFHSWVAFELPESILATIRRNQRTYHGLPNDLFSYCK